MSLIASPWWIPVITALAVCGGLALISFAVYLIYLQVLYSRIPDRAALEQTGEGGGSLLEKNKEYRAVTFNIGFGAYDPAFSFFMDRGILSDGTETRGKRSRARSRQAAEENTQATLKTASQLNPDFLLMQEVDEDADRSYHVNQRAMVEDWFLRRQGFARSCWALYFHSACLFYPFTKPIGRIRSCGLLTLSRFQPEEGVRRSLPVDNGFIKKFFDLDRCLALHRFPVAEAGGRSLVLINIHTSAYDKGGIIREKQLEMLADILKEEYEKGNWVVAGGDYNHALSASIDYFLGQMKRPPWGEPFDETMIPAGFHLLEAKNLEETPTCRNASIPYEKGVNYCNVLDGFIVSENVAGAVWNVDADFASSDHNPVVLKFRLL